MGFWKEQVTRPKEDQADIYPDKIDEHGDKNRCLVKLKKICRQIFKQKHASSKEEEIERLRRILSVELEKIELNEKIVRWLNEIRHEQSLEEGKQSVHDNNDDSIKASNADESVLGHREGNNFLNLSAESGSCILEASLEKSLEPILVVTSPQQLIQRCLTSLEAPDKSEPRALDETATRPEHAKSRRRPPHDDSPVEALSAAMRAAEPSLTALHDAIARLWPPEGLDLEAGLALMRSAAFLPSLCGDARGKAGNTTSTRVR